jgi:multidrug efflux system membrane fusion protein
MKILSALIVGSLVASTTLLTLGCSAGEAQPQQAGGGGGRGGAQQPAVPVTTASVVQKSMPVEITIIGTTEPYSTVAVHSQITGELTSVDFKEGDDVKKGQVLFTLDRRPLDAAVDQAQANLAKDQAQATNARAQSARYQDLLKRGIATHEQSDQMISNAAALDATVAADRAALESAKVQLAYATITAPLSGRTGALMVHAGNLVRAADTIPLVVINQVAPIYVSFGVPEAQLPELKRYMARERIGVQAVPPNDQGAPSTGVITFIDNTVDPTTGTIKIKGTFPNQDHRLWPGQFVNVVVQLTTQANAVVVPATAVQTGQQGSYVFVVKDDKTVDMRTVQVDRVASSEAVIKDGLKTGETIVTDGQLLLVPGSRISVKNADTKVTTP